MSRLRGHARVATALLVSPSAGRPAHSWLVRVSHSWALAHASATGVPASSTSRSVCSGLSAWRRSPAAAPSCPCSFQVRWPKRLPPVDVLGTNSTRSARKHTPPLVSTTGALGLPSERPGAAVHAKALLLLGDCLAQMSRACSAGSWKWSLGRSHASVAVASVGESCTRQTACWRAGESCWRVAHRPSRRVPHARDGSRWKREETLCAAMPRSKLCGDECRYTLAPAWGRRLPTIACTAVVPPAAAGHVEGHEAKVVLTIALGKPQYVPAPGVDSDCMPPVHSTPTDLSPQPSASESSERQTMSESRNCILSARSR
eukprot:scaffold87883_cov63-Phaeocystis_antarctica.AAC.2